MICFISRAQPSVLVFILNPSSSLVISLKFVQQFIADVSLSVLLAAVLRSKRSVLALSSGVTWVA